MFAAVFDNQPLRKTFKIKLSPKATFNFWGVSAKISDLNFQGRHELLL